MNEGYYDRKGKEIYWTCAILFWTRGSALYNYIIFMIQYTKNTQGVNHGKEK